MMRVIECAVNMWMRVTQSVDEGNSYQTNFNSTGECDQSYWLRSCWLTGRGNYGTHVLNLSNWMYIYRIDTNVSKKAGFEKSQKQVSVRF